MPMNLQPPSTKRHRVLDRRHRQRAHASDRRHGRRVPVDLFMNRFLDGQPYLCRMLDVSRTGARLLPTIEPEGDAPPRFMGLQFQLPDREDVVTASGEAVTQDGRTVGVRFTNLSPDAAWALESFISFHDR